MNDYKDLYANSKWASRQDLEASLDLIQDGWCYITSYSAGDDWIAVTVLSQNTAAFYGNLKDARVFRTYSDMMDDLCQLVGVE